MYFNTQICDISCKNVMKQWRWKDNLLRIVRSRHLYTITDVNKLTLYRLNNNKFKFAVSVWVISKYKIHNIFFFVEKHTRK